MQEWSEAEAVDREDVPTAGGRRIALAIGCGVVLGGLPAAVFPLTPGFSAADSTAAIVAAVVATAAAVGVVTLARRIVRSRLPRPGAGGGLLFGAALLSAGAAAIHLSVAKLHVDEYLLFGVFFVGSGIAQLVWPIWILLRPSRPLLVLGALGNGLIVALWAVDRVWGLPLGPEHWKPDPVGFGDTATSAFEVLLVAGCVALLARARPQASRRLVAVLAVLAVAALTALSLLSVLGVGSSILTPTE